MSDNLGAAQSDPENLAIMRRAPRFNRWMADVVSPDVGDRVLEVGAGIGNLTVNLTPRDIYWATDVNPQYLQQLQELVPTRPYLHVQFTDITRPETFPQHQTFDTVICLNVLEHVEDDLTTLRCIRDVLEDGGRAIILVPQGPRLYGEMDRAVGHHRRYTEAQLRAMAVKVGFSVQRIQKFNRIGVLAWWWNGRVLRRSSPGAGQIRLLNWLTPLFRIVDGWLPLPSLSLITTLQKPPSLQRIESRPAEQTLVHGSA